MTAFMYASALILLTISVASAQSTEVQQEMIFWQSITDSTNPAELEAYLEQFPNGVFRTLAQNRLQELRVHADGAATDGAATDGAATDGAATDGAATDGAATIRQS